jgi:hypothetical protein
MVFPAACNSSRSGQVQQEHQEHCVCCEVQSGLCLLNCMKGATHSCSSQQAASPAIFLPSASMSGPPPRESWLYIIQIAVACLASP